VNSALEKSKVREGFMHHNEDAGGETRGNMPLGGTALGTARRYLSPPTPTTRRDDIILFPSTNMKQYGSLTAPVGDLPSLDTLAQSLGLWKEGSKKKLRVNTTQLSGSKIKRQQTLLVRPTVLVFLETSTLGISSTYSDNIATAQ
jgi:hypothetical protein